MVSITQTATELVAWHPTRCATSPVPKVLPMLRRVGRSVFEPDSFAMGGDVNQDRLIIRANGSGPEPRARGSWFPTQNNKMTRLASTRVVDRHGGASFDL